jgi:hypothetical protein
MSANVLHLPRSETKAYLVNLRLLLLLVGRLLGTGYPFRPMAVLFAGPLSVSRTQLPVQLHLSLPPHSFQRPGPVLGCHRVPQHISWNWMRAIHT